MMTLDDMKQAVCGKLPELIDIYRFELPSIYHGNPPEFGWKKDWTNQDMFINWPTEGLQVCHEAEKLLNLQDGTMGKYLYELEKVCIVSGSEVRVKSDQFRYVHATYEQRLEALCRVWWPERFK